MERRRRIPVELTEEAIAGLDALIQRHGVTRTAVVEALGQLSLRSDPTLASVLRRAREIDVERRSRR